MGEEDREERGRQPERDRDPEGAGGPTAEADETTQADAGLARGGPATMTPATADSETVPAEQQRVGEDGDDDGEEDAD